MMIVIVVPFLTISARNLTVVLEVQTLITFVGLDITVVGIVEIILINRVGAGKIRVMGIWKWKCNKLLQDRYIHNQ
jgi:hypothetical protein